MLALQYLFVLSDWPSNWSISNIGGHGVGDLLTASMLAVHKITPPCPPMISNELTGAFGGILQTCMDTLMAHAISFVLFGEQRVLYFSTIFTLKKGSFQLL